MKLRPFNQLLAIGFCLTVCSTNLLAQAPCHADAVRARNFLRFPELEKQYQKIQTSTREAPARIRSIATIPVVIHVVYKGAFENISEEQIRSQLDVLNADFRQKNTEKPPAFFAPLAADMQLEFCLASYDPDGNPTSGITRSETPWSNIGQLIAADGRPRIHYTELGGQDAWDTELYLNIWVCSIGGGVLGFGSYPGTTPPAEDGVVIDPRYFGTTGLAAFYAPHHLGRTATHEIGHYFNLLHIWGPDEFTCTDDDEVSDTPVQRGPYLGCPAYPQFSCGNSAMFMNFMDYTNDACMALFTEGQKLRLWATLDSIRSGLLESTVCEPTSAPETPVAQAPLQLYPNPVSESMQVIYAGRSSASCMIQVYDLSGKLWLEEKRAAKELEKPVLVTTLPEGAYVLRLSCEEGAVCVFFIKN